MKKMNYRERFACTMTHQTPDRAPVDFDGTCLTSCHEIFLEKLYAFLEISGDEAEAKEKMLRHYDIDFRRVGMLFEPESRISDYTKLQQGVYTDCWGITRKNTGMYWDIVSNPFKNAELEDLKQFPWPDAGNISKEQVNACIEQAKRLYYDTEYVIAAEHPVYGYFEIGCWMFGFDDFLYRLMAEPETVEYFFQRYHRYVEDVIELYYGGLGNYIHVTTSGDDFGMQTGPFFSPALFEQQIVPWYQKRISLTKQYTNAKYFHHSCGSVYRLLPGIITMGADILNPIQPGAFEMEPQRLKKDFGDQIVFWGGIDEQHLLAAGTIQQVAEETQRVLQLLGENGGYVVAASHNIQPDVPPENVDAMLCTAVGR